METTLDQIRKARNVEQMAKIVKKILETINANLSHSAIEQVMGLPRFKELKAATANTAVASVIATILRYLGDGRTPEALQSIIEQAITGLDQSQEDVPSYVPREPS